MNHLVNVYIYLLQETGYIAKSLSSLSNVIKCIKKGDQHINFRDSKVRSRNFIGTDFAVLLLYYHHVTPANPCFGACPDQTFDTDHFTCPRD